MRPLLLIGLIAAGIASGATAAECKKDELTFNFSNLPVRDAFAVIANFASLQPQIDSSIDVSEPIRFVCANWRVAAENLARKHNLRLTIDGGTLKVSK